MVGLRRSPPNLGHGVLLRPRLLAELIRRFDTRVVSIIAPAGFGKTTLLAQAVHENGLARRGEDVWLSCLPGDAVESQLAEGLAGALGRTATRPDLSTITEAVLAHAPLPVALILDDVHEVPAGSGGASLLDDLIAHLPANGHIVLAGRTDPAVHVTRMLTTGEALTLGEKDLRLRPDELSALAQLRGLDSDALSASGGWPALASLSASAGRAVAERYVWEEVLGRLTTHEQRALAALALLDGGDIALVETALGADFDTAVVSAVPLVERRADGSLRPHPLWQPALAGVLSEDEAGEIRRRGAVELRGRGDLARAASLLLPAIDDRDWRELSQVIVAGCFLSQWVTKADLLTSWLAQLPASRADEPAALLLRASVNRTLQIVGDDTRPLLDAAMRKARETGDARLELAALTHLGHIAWWHDDLPTLIDLYQRGLALESEGVPEAAGVVGLGKAMVAQLAHDHDAMLAEIERVDRGQLDPGLATGADWLHARALVALGRGAEAIPIADRAATEPGLAMQAVRAERVVARWFAGRILEADQVLRTMDPAHERIPRDRFLLGVIAAGGHALLGRVDEAERCHAIASAERGSVEGRRPELFLGHTRALIAVARGDETAAAGAMTEAIGDDPIDRPLLDVLRVVLAPLYLLLPQRRHEIDGIPLGPDYRRALEVARLLVAARSGPVRPVPFDSEQVLSALGVRWALELAVRTTDIALARFVLEVWGRPGRDQLRDWSMTGEMHAGARSLLKTLPTPPSVVTRLRVLGPMALERGGEPVTHADWRRERVRSLLAMLVNRGRTSREVCAAALWPESDAEAALGNLRVTLGYLQKVLEPERASGDATWFVRTDGDTLSLAEEGLLVDAWELDALLDEADAADRSGAPSAALRSYEGALDLWHGDYLADVYDDWAGPERDRVRARFLTASIRAGELLVGQGEVDRALRIATRAVEAEPWSEPAHRLVMASHLARGDRASARRALDRCYSALAELGVDPEPSTAVFERAILAGVTSERSTSSSA
jgi:DNA-binding SARP family transcriptional activator